MITKKDYIEWYENEKRKMINSGRYKTSPRFLFSHEYDDWMFNKFNWNGGDILRNFLIDNLDELNNIKVLDIKYYYHEDQTTIFMFTSEKWYEISWYKDRGRTDIIKMNGKPIYLEDYIDLCNLLNINLNHYMMILLRY